MNKKIILLQIRRHYGELDWLFPLLFRLKKKNFKIITYFDDHNSYLNLTKNLFLYKNWKSLNTDYYIQKKTDKLILKLIFKIFVSLNNKLKNLNFLSKYINLISYKVYNINTILKKNDIKDFKLFFCSNNNFSNLYKYFKKNNKIIKIIRFPTSQHVRNYEKQLFLNKRILFGDKYLFRFRDEANEYFGSRIYEYYSKKKNNFLW